MKRSPSLRRNVNVASLSHSLSLLAAMSVAALVGLAPACGHERGSSQFPAPSQKQEAWDPNNDPLNLGPGFVRELDALPVSAKLAKVPWSDSYWPSRKGGISHRWLSSEPNDFQYASPSKDELARMSLRERAELSPAEKYDAYRGAYDYPLVKSEWKRVSPQNASWEGLCHGWAPAAIAFDEPQSLLAVNPDGIEIPFGSSDLKALLLYVQGQAESPPARMLGGRCNVAPESPDEALNRPECRDVNAGAFHVILANQLGLRKQGFVFDVQRDLQVWNQPVYSFESELLAERPPSPGAAPNAVREVVVESRVGYVNEISAQWLSLGAESSRSLSEVVYKYALEVDAQGRIVGGEWDAWKRPDFLWVEEKAPLRGRFAALGALYEKARRAEMPFPEPAPAPAPAPEPAPEPVASPAM
ncbi:MAG: hypothetical protein IOD12_14635 [Silvanigrellales bacterium]|nr:hypothetical protein [Silvanigrellales bacterium]